MQYDNLPQDLRDNGEFCLWRYKDRKKDNKLTKVPYQISGSKAMPNNEKTFSDYAAAIAAVENYNGLGIGVFRGFSAVDIDHCIDENGKLSDMAQKIVAMFKGCYIEKSPFGTGLRIIFMATGFKHDTAKYYINNQKIGLEVYVFGSTNKFVTVTGNVFQAGDIVEAEAALQTMLDRYMLRSVKKADAPRKSDSVSYLTDESVIAKASSAKNSGAFLRLWDGDVRSYASHSEADLALCSLLAFWCDGM